MYTDEVEYRNTQSPRVITPIRRRQRNRPPHGRLRTNRFARPLAPLFALPLLIIAADVAAASSALPQARHIFALAHNADRQPEAKEDRDRDQNQADNHKQNPDETTQPDDREPALLDFAQSVLLNPSDDIDQPTRRNAATQLLTLGTPEAISVLNEALRSEHQNVVIAVAESIAQNGRHNELLDSLIVALRAAEVDTAHVLGRAMQNYPDGTRRIADLALDEAQSVDHRLGAVHALGAQRNRNAARHLMTLLERENNSQKITRAACKSLGTLTGFSHGDDIARWQQWWQWAKDLPRDEWFKAMAQMLSRRMAELEQMLQKQRARNENAEQRLLSAYRSLFPLAPLDAQIRELPRLLNDETTVVRAFAVERVEVLLRDSHKIPQDVQQALAEGLADPVPRLRQAAAQLLDELDYDQLTARLADRLTQENNEDVLATYIEVLSVRASPAAVQPLQEHLMHERLGRLAANALWHALAEAGINGEKRRAVADRAVHAMDKHHTPEHARLAAFVGDENALKKLIRHLDEDNEQLQQAIAQGLAERGRAEPLLERADDPAVYPHALRAVCRGQADPEKLKTLAELPPPNGHASTWRDAVTQITTQLEPILLLQADDILAKCDWTDLQFRIKTLARITNVQPQSLEPTERVKLFARLAELYMNHKEFSPAHQLLETLPKNETTASITMLRFQAAALAQAYDSAAAFHQEPGPWIALLQQSADQWPDAAAALRDEIARRFEDHLNGELGEQFHNVSARLAEANSNREGDGGAPAPDEEVPQDSHDSEESGA